MANPGSYGMAWVIAPDVAADEDQLAGLKAEYADAIIEDLPKAAGPGANVTAEDVEFAMMFSHVEPGDPGMPPAVDHPTESLDDPETNTVTVLGQVTIV